MYKVGDYIEVNLYGQWQSLVVDGVESVILWNVMRETHPSVVRPAQCSEPANTIRHMIANHDDGRYYE